AGRWLSTARLAPRRGVRRSASASQAVVARGADAVGANRVGGDGRVLLAGEAAYDFSLCIEEIERHQLARLGEPVIDDGAGWRIRSSRMSTGSSVTSSSPE